METINKNIRELLIKKNRLFFFLIFSFSFCKAQVATINISNINTTVMDKTSLLFGITFDARTSLTANGISGQIGYYNANGTVIPAVDALFNDFPMSTLRYPGNGIATGFDWKKSIGPIGLRPNQNLLGGLGSPQPVNFGFDEFMAMTAAKGVLPADIQIMVPIYDSTAVGLTATQANAAVANVIANNADWVEYCNAPNDSTNPGGGIDWAAQRAANGHPLPYGIKIWNIGNEPWSGFEFGPSATGCNKYITLVTPIINAMLAVDPTIRITLPTTGNYATTTTWFYTLLNSSLVAQGKVYALSQHYFAKETTVNGTAPIQGVNAINNNLNSLISNASNFGVKVFIGDYAHYIFSPNPTTAQKDSAMQWLGANLEADFLLMLSQKSTVERANFWAYGNAQAVWHPIRYNSVNNYTLMPAAYIYKLLFPAFLDKSIAVTTTSPIASDLNPYSVRSNAFISNDLSKLNIVSVNRDKINTVPLQVNGINGYLLLHARLLTASALNAETIIESIATTDISGNYIMPPMSVLILEYADFSLLSLPITLISFTAQKVNQNEALLEWTTAQEINNKGFSIERSSDAIKYETIGFLNGKINSLEQNDYSFVDTKPKPSKNYYRLKQIDIDGKFQYSKVVCLVFDFKQELLIYPNPVTNYLTITANELLNEVSIFDISGQVIFTESINTTNKTIDFSSLSKGMYMIEIHSKNSMSTTKVIKTE